MVEGKAKPAEPFRVAAVLARRRTTRDRSAADDSDSRRSYGRKLIAGLALRALVAAILYGAVWLSFQTEAPGSRSVRAWTSDAVTRDMDFQAAEAWYARYFGGSPSFLPVFRSRKEEPLAVSGSWNRSEAMQPVAGRIVRTFAQDGAGCGLRPRQAAM